MITPITQMATRTAPKPPPARRHVRTQSRDHGARWSDCCGTPAYSEWRVWVDGVLMIDTFETGFDFFDDEKHAISTALQCAEEETK